ncbi:MAG: hypothetical protein ACE5I5_08005 [Candidatus Heimdallarchaeota archaeon]
MSAFIDSFQRNVCSLTGHEIVAGKESFAREYCMNGKKQATTEIISVLIRINVLYMDTFLMQVKKCLGNDQEIVVEKFLEKIKEMISRVFREALLPAIPAGYEFSMSGFAVRLQQQLQQELKTLEVSECDWRVLHAFSFEILGNGMLEVYAGFAFDFEIPNQNEIPIFDFKISNFELESKFIDSNGNSHTDLLNLDDI